MIGNSAIQFGHLRLSQWRYGIALYDVVPKGFNKLNLFIHTELSSLLKELWVHTPSIASKGLPA